MWSWALEMKRASAHLPTAPDAGTPGVVLGKKGKADVAEESRFAYKDIEIVMENQKDLVIPVKRLKTIGVVKG